MGAARKLLVVGLVVASLVAGACCGPAKVDDGRGGCAGNDGGRTSDVALAASEAYAVITALTMESVCAEPERKVFYENYDFEELIERILDPLGVTWTFGPGIDTYVDVSGTLHLIPARSLSEACRAAGFLWHAGRSTVYIYASDDPAPDKVYTADYRLDNDREGLTAPPEPNAHAASWRIEGQGWPGMNSALTVEIIDPARIRVTGFAADHAYIMERIQWAK